MQEIELDKHIRLIDSPGVVLASKQNFDPTEVALKNALHVENLEDPALVVSAILRRCSVKVLMLHYMIPEFSDCDQFLPLVARKLGRMKRGPTGLKCCRQTSVYFQVLNDWNSGKLHYYTEPPEDDAGDKVQILTSDVLEAFSKEFDLDGIDCRINRMIDEFPNFTMLE